MRDPLPTADEWPPSVELRRSPESVARHLAALREVVASAPPARCPEPYRGIVWVGGGPYWPGIVAGVRLLREVGCGLPVEVWYRGQCETVDRSQVAGLDVKVIDLDAIAAWRGDNRITPGDEYRGGWEAKLYALTHTVFDQALFLDADAYAVCDPAPLLDLLCPAEPFVFWSDLPGLERNVKWAHVWPDGEGSGVPAVQGGQLLIDTRHAARLLAVAHWICQHSDFYFAHMYGDQDAWRVGLAAGCCGWRCLGAADWRDVAFVCGHGSRNYIVHRCQSKLFAGTAPARCDRLPLEHRIFEHFQAAITS